MTIRSNTLIAFAVTGMLLIHGGATYGADSASRQTGSFQKIATELGLNESEQPLREMFPNWRAPKKVMVHVGRNPARIEFLTAVVPEGVTLIPVSSKAEALAQLGDVDGLIAGWGFCTPDIIAAGKRLRWIHINSAGVDDLALEEMRARNIVLTNQQRTFAPEISEHVLALMLALTRGLDGALSLQRVGQWNWKTVAPSRLWMLQDQTLLVVGLGGVGVQVAKKAHALGMRVIATRNSSRERPEFVEYVGLADELPELIAQADVVVNATPLTPQTTGLFDAAMFRRMQRHAYFINVGRGPSVVTADLVSALHSGTIGGAGLDVTDPEPLPEGHPLWSAPNLIITPHIASETGPNSSTERMWLLAREQLRRFIAGDRLYSVVDLSKGY